MIDYRLSYLIGDSKEKYLLDQAAEMTKMRKMDLLLAIEKVNEVASDLFETEILITETEIEIPKMITRNWIDLFFNQKREEVVFLEEERQAMIFLLTFAQFEELSVYYFQDFLFVSKNTILKDLKKLRAALAERGVTLEYALPGGPGTLEEITEMISWSRIGQNPNPCIMFNESGFYNPLKNLFDNMVENEFLTEADRAKTLFSVSLKEIDQFIKNYTPPEIRTY